MQTQNPPDTHAETSAARVRVVMSVVMLALAGLLLARQIYVEHLPGTIFMVVVTLLLLVRCVVTWRELRRLSR